MFYDHGLHHKFTDLILTEPFSIFLSIASFILMFLYILQFLTLPKNYIIDKDVRKNRLFMRAITWGIFGGVYLLFAEIIKYKDVSTWRATARVALMFLILPEIVYQAMILAPILKAKKWTKILHRF